MEVLEGWVRAVATTGHTSSNERQSCWLV